MAQRRSSLFLKILEGALNDYVPVDADRHLAVLDISSYQPLTVITRLFCVQKPLTSSGTFKVSGENSHWNLRYEVIEPEQVETFSAKTTDVINYLQEDDVVNSFREVIVQAKSTAGIDRFDVIAADRVLSRLISTQSSKDVLYDEQISSELLRWFGDCLLLGGLLIIGEKYVASWGIAPRDQTDLSLTQPVDGLKTIKPDKLIELATYKLSVPKKGYHHLRRPLFTVRTHNTFSKVVGTNPNYIAKEEFLEDGSREFALALERSQKPFDDSRIVETVKQENEAIFEGLQEHIRSTRFKGSRTDYGDDLNRLLSNTENSDPLYSRLAQCLYLQVLLEALNGGIDLSAARMVFWMAYESRAPESGIMPASEPGPYPLFGYSFGPRHKGQLHRDRPSSKSLTRFWLNIILHSEVFTSAQENIIPLRPPSVHEWFVEHSPKVFSSVEPFEQPLETLTVYLGNADNRRLALVEGHNSSRRHHRIELLPLRDSNEGEYWGFQLAEELARIESHHLDKSPYKALPWPYVEEDDHIPSCVSVGSFIAETERLKSSFSSSRFNPSYGWIRCSLYSVFLSMCLGDVRHRCSEVPEWLQFFKKVLLRMGYESLVQMIDRACIDSSEYLNHENSHPLTSLTWVAPPLLVSLIESRPRPLGSILIVSSRLLPVVTFRQLKNQLLTTFLALREGEELIESERSAKRASLLEGHARSVEGFSHEISKLANAIDQHYLLRMNAVFEMDGERLQTNPDDWLTRAGSVSCTPEWREAIAKWRVCPTPALLRGLSDVLYMWSSSSFWWEGQGLHKEQSIEDALRTIREIGIRVGVTMRFGLFSGLPLGISDAEQIEENVREYEQFFSTLMPRVTYSGPRLMWRGADETRFAESAFIRMSVVSLSNALNNMDVNAPRLEVVAAATDKEIIFEVLNSRLPEERKDSRADYFGSTESALANCVRILNNGASPERFMFFDIDPTDERMWKTTTIASLGVNNREGTQIQWLSTS